MKGSSEHGLSHVLGEMWKQVVVFMPLWMKEMFSTCRCLSANIMFYYLSLLNCAVLFPHDHQACRKVNLVEGKGQSPISLAYRVY